MNVIAGHAGKIAEWSDVSPICLPPEGCPAALPHDLRDLRQIVVRVAGPDVLNHNVSYLHNYFLPPLLIQV
jgi:hypothetical protein